MFCSFVHFITHLSFLTFQLEFFRCLTHGAAALPRRIWFSSFFLPYQWAAAAVPETINWRSLSYLFPCSSFVHLNHRRLTKIPFWLLNLKTLLLQCHIALSQIDVLKFVYTSICCSPSGLCLHSCHCYPSTVVFYDRLAGSIHHFTFNRWGFIC